MSKLKAFKYLLVLFAILLIATSIQLFVPEIRSNTLSLIAAWLSVIGNLLMVVLCIFQIRIITKGDSDDL